MSVEHIARGRVYAFDVDALEETVAHNGIGSVLAKRVLERESASLRFVDLVEVPPGSTIGRHRHGADQELYIAISGHSVIELDGRETLMGPGDVAINRSGGVHALTVIGDEPFRMVVVCTGPDAEWPDQEL
ncbi:MAG TPA: cupin domain-containing protein [Nocardioidaceae bacterium]|nr:cupin domain-containing protein [Nocardioidaceae bacterium]